MTSDLFGKNEKIWKAVNKRLVGDIFPDKKLPNSNFSYSSTETSGTKKSMWEIKKNPTRANLISVFFYTIKIPNERRHIE